METRSECVLHKHYLTVLRGDRSGSLTAAHLRHVQCHGMRQNPRELTHVCYKSPGSVGKGKHNLKVNAPTHRTSFTSAASTSFKPVTPNTAPDPTSCLRTSASQIFTVLNSHTRVHVVLQNQASVFLRKMDTGASEVASRSQISSSLQFR